jgi:hypothetical protein
LRKAKLREAKLREAKLREATFHGGISEAVDEVVFKEASKNVSAMRPMRATFADVVVVAVSEVAAEERMIEAFVDTS